MTSPLADGENRPIDLVIVRENNEGEYSQLGGRFNQGLPDETAIQESVFTRKGISRIADYALSLAAGRQAGAAHLTGVAAAWAYNLGVKRTAASWVPYALAFGLLPAFVTLGLPGRPWPPAWAMAAGKARDWFARRPERLDTMGAAGGVMMIGLGATLAATD